MAVRGIYFFREIRGVDWAGSFAEEKIFGATGTFA